MHEKNGSEKQMEIDERWMELALEEAALAREAGEVPVGAVIVRGEELLARALNRPISLHDPSAHAEILAIRQAAAAAGNYRLAGTTLYVTLEPCIMCAGAIIHARIERLVFGAADPKNGAAVSLYRLFEDRRFNHAVAITGGVLREACAEILSGFFREKRLTSSP
ncbi:MAG: tRNA-specific adenosine deaminase [Deltaproteobacteria bacterium RBG_16_58_17]|nr:MAG: tRNA-specific adenosine deaminase [Deltaproteobacteria bacterium RBG_16_58_17]OHE17654.1 MAG: tRNA-specific adenosine deaminase [Syntrophobacterales bacterium GWC2_56_13]